MERMIREFTEQLIEKLPTDREFYSPEDLQVLDIPEFITERVVIEMNQNLNESLTPPETEWASMDTDAVQFAWRNFIEAIKAEVKMPATFARSIFETAVADTLELALRPRRAIPESLFGADKELTIDKVKKRIKYITVGRQLAAALVRYMEKKDKKLISLEECREIVTKVDEKLITGYNSLDWAKETEPLFLLAGPKVDTEFFRVYFEDKGLHKVAKKFDLLSEPLNRTAFIEVLSAPELDEEQISEIPDSPKLKITKQAAKKEKGKPGDKEISKEELAKKEKPESGGTFIPDDSILGSFQKRRVGSDPDEEEHGRSSLNPTDSDNIADQEKNESVSSDKPLHERFIFDSEAMDEIDASAPKESATIYDEMNLKKDDDSDDIDEDEAEKGGVSLPSIPQFDSELLRKWKTIGGMNDEDEPVLSETEKPEEDEEPVASIELYNETDDEEDVPMWRAFLEREDLSRIKEEEEEFDHKKSPSDAEANKNSIEKKIVPDISFTGLVQWMGDESDRFVNELFGGSDEAYKEALAGIVEKDNWKKASKYLEKEVFEINNIKLFDEVAVDFIDRLHTYYNERK